MDETRHKLEGELDELFGRGVGTALPDREFDRLALEVFRYQFDRYAPYGAFCRARGRIPETVASWTEIPALPTSAFKVAELTTLAPDEIQVVYHTSGTTQGGRPGRHLLPDTRLYD